VRRKVGQLCPPDCAPDQQKYDGADGGANQFADKADRHDLQAAENKAADDSADQADGKTMGVLEWIVVGLGPPYAGFGARRLLGVDSEIFTSSSVMSAGTSPNSGVDR